MAVNRSGANVGYGLSNALQNLAPQPIISQRDPGVNDKAELGSLWINPADQSCWAAVNAAAGQTNWLSLGGGAAVFDSLAVNGNAAITGDLIVDGELTSGVCTTDLLTVNGDTTLGGDITMGDGDGLITMAPNGVTGASTTPTNNSNVGRITVTGLTTAADASQDIVITCDQIIPNSGIFVSAYNLNASGNDAAVGIKSTVVNTVAGTLTVTLINNGLDALGAGDDVVITYWVIS